MVCLKLPQFLFPKHRLISVTFYHVHSQRVHWGGEGGEGEEEKTKQNKTKQNKTFPSACLLTKTFWTQKWLSVD